MGNALRVLAECVRKHQHENEVSNEIPYEGDDRSAALAHHLLHFEATHQIPKGLDSYVQATPATQIIWYTKLLVAWKNSNPPPSTAPEVAHFITQTLQNRRKSDTQGILRFYGISIPTPSPSPSLSSYPPWPQGVQYELITLPVEAGNVPDGDTITVFVEVRKKEIPSALLDAISQRRKARGKRDYHTADALQRQILAAGYKVFDAENGRKEVITHKYRIRLRGVDSPEKGMPHGPQSKQELVKLVQGKQLRAYVYTADRYGRLVADLHTDQGFVQEILLKKGCVWHYTAYDHRPQFSKWEQEAKSARLGLWAAKNPEKPWEFRKKNRQA